MESLCDLLFEVSNEDRLKILQRIRDSPSSISSLAKDLDLSSQEASARALSVGATIPPRATQGS